MSGVQDSESNRPYLEDSRCLWWGGGEEGGREGWPWGAGEEGPGTMWQDTLSRQRESWGPLD